MNAAPVLPPAPLSATCPLWMLVEWSEVFRNGLVSRSKVLLEVHANEGPSNAGERWIALLTWNLKSAHLRTALPPALRKEYRIPHRNLVRTTVGKLFQKMTSARRSVWFVPLVEWGGAAIFIRMPTNDPALTKILTFNRQGRTPRTFQMPRRRVYPEKLRKAYAEQWAKEQKQLSRSYKKPSRVTLRQRGDSPPRRRGQGGTPQA